MTNLNGSYNSPEREESATPIVQILHGKTAFPTRPINQSRFLIGAGNICQLQLGGFDIPLLHTILLIQGAEISCDAIVSEPALMVNGKKQRQATLQNGDILSIGTYEFQITIPAAFGKNLPSPLPQQIDAMRGPHELDELTDHLWNLPEEQLAAELDQLSASDLLDLLEDEMSQIEEYEEIQQSGIETMIAEALDVNRIEQQKYEHVSFGQISLNESNSHEFANTTMSEIQLMEEINRLTEVMHTLVDAAELELNSDPVLNTQLEQTRQKLDLMLNRLEQRRRIA
jgi:hypothetical protein